MKILLDAQPSPPPHVVSAVHFDPWPFTNSARLQPGSVFIDPEGLLYDPEQVYLEEPDNKVLALLSDGRYAATSVAGLAKFQGWPR